MQIKNWDEDSFIHHLANQFPASGTLMGIGDDCAVIPGEEGMAWLATSDAFVEGVHFLKEQMAASEVGYKVVAVNVSDIAAMGGKPKYAFLTVAIPSTLDYEWLKQMTQGVKEACQTWEVLLLGGDTVRSKRDIFISLTLIGSAIQTNLKYRHMAEPGDLICVNGYLGDSGGGLKALHTETPNAQRLIDAHFRPQPNPQEAMWLASHAEVHGMMDISDGLNCDLHRLATASKCGGVIELTQLPISETLRQVSIANNWNALELALTGGEDYCLLFTVAKKTFNSINQSFSEKFEKELYNIGEVTEKIGELSYQENGHPVQMQLKDFQH